MKQILQNLGNGETILAEVPCPRRAKGALLVETTRTLVSLGSEKMLIDFGKGSWLAKARSQPDKVKQVLQKIKTDGLWTTLNAVKAKLDTPIPLGYCHVGRVVEVDSSSPFAVGDRVVTNGAHAEMVAVAENLAAKIPSGVTDEQAAFAVVGAIGLQGIRLIQPTLGERVVVSGLGLIGLLCVQMLRAHGCQVLGIDFDPQKLDLARQFGAETVDLKVGQDPIEVANHWTDGAGVDAVLITAATKSDELIHQAATMCRKRGRIVLVGVVGLNLQRTDFYEKELSFQVSCSYGPGRYDGSYEKKGLDYPIGFVRWTEKRNFEAVLGLMADGKLDVNSLISHRYCFDQALEAYSVLLDGGSLGVLLEYSEAKLEAKRKDRIKINLKQVQKSDGELKAGFIGAGNFTIGTLLPLLPKYVKRHAIVSSTGVSAAHAAKKFGFVEVATNSSEILLDSAVDVVFITTPHNSHARMVCDALDAGKHVFVEKPLAMNSDELELVEEAAFRNPSSCVMVGFNRRFSPHVVQMKKWLQSSAGSLAINITVNAGSIPQDHWTQDLSIGGGRIVGEACHFIDLARFLADASIESVHSVAMAGPGGKLGDCVVLNLSFVNGSIATIQYLANGCKDFPKERIEVFSSGRVISCNNFRHSKEYGGNRSFKTRIQDKGHAKELELFCSSLVAGGDRPIPFDQMIEVTKITLEAANQVYQQLAEFGQQSI